MIASFYYYDQDPSGFFFLVQIRAFCYSSNTGASKFKYEKENEKNSGRSIDVRHLKFKGVMNMSKKRRETGPRAVESSNKRLPYHLLIVPQFNENK